MIKDVIIDINVEKNKLNLCFIFKILLNFI